ncbi:MAG: GNAT family N-acetyltransferase/peptidase C39 family protein [Planctomycetota bacterium]|jgi:ribosomal-protein-alanine acetyltransferase|nr:GNAT family N-acetyltransferase/peptidase C39 family protein [Planctomycetota bacterium]
MGLTIREATLADLDAIVAVETAAFVADRFSRRTLRSWLNKEHRVFLVAVDDDNIAGYILVIHHQGTRLGRVYSLAVSPLHHRRGIGRRLMAVAQDAAVQRGCIDLRLEVANSNLSAIEFYRSEGYRSFGIHRDYYSNHDDALRMQKRILHPQANTKLIPLEWMPQQTSFTCGPASLMMALHYLLPSYQASLAEEIQLWREATTIFMTSGHGGCHPMGLALAARKRGLVPEIWLTNSEPLFLDGVRQESKKTIIRQVDADFRAAVSAAGIPVHQAGIAPELIEQACDTGAVVLLLISTWRLDNTKAPHWVVVSGHDTHCFYLHDPDPGKDQIPVDCQHCPVARSEIERMCRFGSRRLQTAVVLRAPPSQD